MPVATRLQLHTASFSTSHATASETEFTRIPDSFVKNIPVVLKQEDTFSAKVTKHSRKTEKKTAQLSQRAVAPQDARRLRLTKNWRTQDQIPGVPYGDGTTSNPIRIPIRDEPNMAGCLHCPLGIEKCDCNELQTLIWSELQEVGLKRRSGHRENNAKSILPVLVARLGRIMEIDRTDVFWDLGCGNGSVVMQIALQTGATAVGVEIQRENIDIAERVWPIVRNEWLKRHPDRIPGQCIFVAADMFEALERADLPTPTTAWAANLLFGSLLNHRLGEKLIELPKLKAVGVMKDLFPRGRSYAMKRNPIPYERFPRMEDHEWQPGSVEWSAQELQIFSVYINSNLYVRKGVTSLSNKM